MSSASFDSSASARAVLLAVYAVASIGADDARQRAAWAFAAATQWANVQGAIGRRRTYDGLIDQFLPGTYDPPAFALKLAHKDVSLAVALGKEVSVPMRLSNLALEEMTEAMNRGWGERDSRVAMLLQEERAGVSIAVDAGRLVALVKDHDTGTG